MIYGLMGAIIFSGYIVYDTNNLIKRYTYDEYITAAIELYLDIINIFIAFLQMLQATDWTPLSLHFLSSNSGSLDMTWVL